MRGHLVIWLRRAIGSVDTKITDYKDLIIIYVAVLSIIQLVTFVVIFCKYKLRSRTHTGIHRRAYAGLLSNSQQTAIKANDKGQPIIEEPRVMRNNYPYVRP